MNDTSVNNGFLKSESHAAYTQTQQQFIEFCKDLRQQMFAKNSVFDRLPVPVSGVSSFDLDKIGPFSRIKLAHPWAGAHIEPGIEELWAVVVSVDGDLIEAYTFQTQDLRNGRITVHKNQVIDCLAPLEPGELEPESALATNSTFRDVTER